MFFLESEDPWVIIALVRWFVKDGDYKWFRTDLIVIVVLQWKSRNKPICSREKKV